MLKKRLVIICILLISMILCSCQFLLFPQGYVGMNAFFDNSPMLEDMILIDEFETMDRWNIEVYTSDNHLLVRLDSGQLLIYSMAPYERLDETDFSTNNLVSVFTDSEGDLQIVDDNGMVTSFKDSLIQESVPREYTNIDGADQNLDSIGYYFEWDIEYAVGSGHLSIPVVDIVSNAQVDSIEFPENFIGRGWYHHTVDALYVAAISAISIDPEVQNVHELNIREPVTIKIAEFPKESLGTWKDNYKTYWNEAFSITSGRTGSHYYSEGNYVFNNDSDDRMINRFVQLNSYYWKGAKIIDVTSGEFIFQATDGLYLPRGSAVSTAGKLLFCPWSTGINVFRIQE